MAKKIGHVLVILLLGALVWSSSISAAPDGEPIGAKVATKESAYARGVTLPVFTINGIEIKQDRKRTYQEFFKHPENKLCKPFCVQPHNIGNAETIKLEDFPALADDINAGKILLLDLRSADFFATGTLPGAIHFPYHNLFGNWADKAMQRLIGDREIIVFCNGWYCNQSPTGVRALERIGYSAKIRYFRGGCQDWIDAGLPLVKPN